MVPTTAIEHVKAFLPFLKLHLELIKFLAKKRATDNIDKMTYEECETKFMDGFKEHGRKFDPTLLPALVEAFKESLDAVIYEGIHLYTIWLSEPEVLEYCYTCYRPDLL